MWIPLIRWSEPIFLLLNSCDTVYLSIKYRIVVLYCALQSEYSYFLRLKTIGVRVEYGAKCGNCSCDTFASEANTKEISR